MQAIEMPVSIGAQSNEASRPDRGPAAVDVLAGAGAAGVSRRRQPQSLESVRAVLTHLCFSVLPLVIRRRQAMPPHRSAARGTRRPTVPTELNFAHGEGRGAYV
jgi:hypothetical protein